VRDTRAAPSPENRAAVPFTPPAEDVGPHDHVVAELDLDLDREPPAA
jgi:hypothetical protein